ncbi:MAG: SUMF1/EgtB/PvdO family nonheme iron enzyme [Opitutales bacterium]|nr:SUMF1/EgtB/PvdO family nonheme iron enzyme [Opitutales bacterium]
MKYKTTARFIQALSPCLFLVFAGTPLTSETLLYEGFDMEPGVLDNKSGATSFGWRMDGGEEITWWAWEQDEPGFSLYHGVTADGLSYPGIESVGGAFEFRDEAQQGNNVVHRFIPGFLSYFSTSGQRWISVLMNPSIDGDPENGGWFQFTLSDAVAGHNSIYMGISNNPTRDQTVWSAGGERLKENGVSGAKWAVSDVPVIDGETVFLVMKLDFDAKTAAWWVNPDPAAEDPGDPVSEFTMVEDLGVDRVMLRVYNNGPAQGQDGADYTGTRIDEIRMGRTYSSVAGTVPSPVVAHPEDTAAAVGADAAFTVEVADPEAAEIRWEVSYDDGKTYGNVSDGSVFGGVFTDVLTVFNVSSFLDGLVVRAVVTVAEQVYKSDPALLSVVVALVPEFLADPQAATVQEGDPAVFHVEVSGVPEPGIGWEMSTDSGASFVVLETGGPFSGVDSTELMVFPTTLDMDGHLFRAVAQNSEGTIISATAALSVTPAPTAPVFITDPVNRRVGEGAETLFAAEVSGYPSFEYQWQLSTDGESFSNITDGALGGELFRGTQTNELRVLSAVTFLDGAFFRLRAQNSEGTAFSSPARLDLVAVSFVEWVAAAGLPVEFSGAADRHGPLKLTNLEAYGMGLLPQDAVPEDLPRMERPSGGPGRVVLLYRVNTDATDILVSISQSADLVDWHPAEPAEEHTVWAADGVEGREAVFDVGGDAPLFLRVAVTGPAPEGFSLIPAGSYKRGDSHNELDIIIGVRPAHDVYVSEFYMAQTTVTYEEWRETYDWAIANGYSFDNPGTRGSYQDEQGVTRGGIPDTVENNRHPVVGLNWYDIVKWCNAKSEREGLTPVYYTDGAHTEIYRAGQFAQIAESHVDWSADGYRLPTEAEWEKAARGGLVEKRWPWGNETVNETLANYYHNTSEGRGTTPVGTFSPNGFGLYDMAGNVDEILWDRYQREWYIEPGAKDADTRGPMSGDSRVIRGGSWFASVSWTRIEFRMGIGPLSQNLLTGFRVARSQ